jgi:hypothetical protein
VRGQLEDGAAIQDVLEDRAGVVGPASLSRDDGEQLLVAAARIVARLRPRRQLPDVLRHVAQEPAGHLERLFLGLGQVVDHPAFVHLGALVSQILLRDVDAERRLHDRGTASEEMADPLDHDAEVGQADLHRRQTRHRAQCQGHDRSGAKQLLDGVGAGVRRDVRATDLFEAADAASRGVQETDVGQPPLQRQVVGEAVLVADGGIGRAAAHGEVAARDHGLSAVDLDRADDHVRRGERSQLVAVVLRGPSQSADLLKRAFVGQRADPLANRELSAPALPLDPFGSPHGRCQTPAALQFLDLRLPAHDVPPRSPDASRGR